MYTTQRGNQSAGFANSGFSQTGMQTSANIRNGSNGLDGDFSHCTSSVYESVPSTTQFLYHNAKALSFPNSPKSPNLAQFTQYSHQYHQDSQFNSNTFPKRSPSTRTSGAYSASTTRSPIRPKHQTLLQGNRQQQQLYDYDFVFSRFVIQDFANSELDEFSPAALKKLKREFDNNNDGEYTNGTGTITKLGFKSFRSEARKHKKDYKTKLQKCAESKLKGLVTPDVFSLDVLSLLSGKSREATVGSRNTTMNDDVCSAEYQIDSFGQTTKMIDPVASLKDPMLRFTPNRHILSIYKECLSSWQQTCFRQMVDSVADILEKELDERFQESEKFQFEKAFKQQWKLEKTQMNSQQKPGTKSWLLGAFKFTKSSNRSGNRNMVQKAVKKTVKENFRRDYDLHGPKIVKYTTRVVELQPNDVKKHQHQRRLYEFGIGNGSGFNNVSTAVCYFPVDMEYGFCFEVKVVAQVRQGSCEDPVGSAKPKNGVVSAGAVPRSAKFREEFYVQNSIPVKEEFHLLSVECVSSDDNGNSDTMVNEEEQDPFSDSGAVLPLTPEEDYFD